MQLYPTFYFRPIDSPITLSHHFDIILRNPHQDELYIFEKNIETLCNRLSDKEKRRILYTLYPMGNITTQGSLHEQFVKELSQIWIIAVCNKKLPFEQGLLDYGFLCGFISDGIYLRNPGGFVCDTTNLSPRELLRALKKELPKAARQILNPSMNLEDIEDLTINAAYWDSIFIQNNISLFIQLAKSLRTAHYTKDLFQNLLQYCIAAEILLVHNPSTGDSKMPMNRQFISKLTLVRHLMIKYKKQNNLYTLEELQAIFAQLYELRSQLIHGRPTPKLSNKEIANFTNILYPTIRLTMELQRIDPDFVEFIKKI